MEQENRENFIVRYLCGEANYSEIVELKEWVDSSNDNLLYFLQLKNIWDSTEKIPNQQNINVEKAYSNVKDKVVFKSSASNFWYYWKRIAAVLIIPLLLANLLYFSLRNNNHAESPDPVYNELFAAFGTRSAFRLSDGTLVWLNSGSSLRYPDRFVDNDRSVFLKGEAYFEVESDEHKPFIVGTSNLTVRATGTKFNVSEYSSDNKSEVTLVSGKVEVTMPVSVSNSVSYKLVVNQHFSFDKSSEATSIINGDTYKYICWKDGKLVFRNEPLNYVVKELSNEFNVDIEIQSKEIENYSFRATFQDESLEEILKLLKVSPIDYFEVKREALPDGSFPRKKVIIVPARKERT